MYLTSVRFMNSCQPLDISTAWETGRDLLYRNLDEELLVPEDDDIPLSGRVGHISAHCLTLGNRGQYTCERSRKRHEMAECDRMECVHLLRADGVG